MSKVSVRKAITALTKEELVQLVLDMYDAREDAKEYLEYYATPNEEVKLEEYKNIIYNEFYPAGKRAEPKFRFSVCKKAISDFKGLKPAPDKLADLMLYLPELGAEFTHKYGDMWEQYYTAVENNFRAALKFIADNNLFAQFETRIRQCLDWSEDCGWGFTEVMWDTYYDYAFDNGWEEPDEVVENN